MSFIGIICESKNENYIKQILSKNFKQETVIVFNNENIENMKNITFETIVITSKDSKILYKRQIVEHILLKAKYLIVNEDEEINLNIDKNQKLNVITYGFSSKSMITASSVKEESVMLCIQSDIKDIKENIIEPQEINIQKLSKKTTTYILMGLATLLLMYGINSPKL